MFVIDSLGLLARPVSQGGDVTGGPGGGRQGNENGIDLQTSQQHAGGKHHLAEPGIIRVVGRGAHGAEAGTDVVEAGNDRRHVRLEIAGIEGQQQDHAHQQHYIQGEIGIHRMQHRVIQPLALKLDDIHGAWMQQMSKLPLDVGKQHHHTAHLQTAAGGARTAADEHQDDEHRLGQLGPQVKIRGAVARGGKDGGCLEGRLPDGHAQAQIQMAHQVDDDNHRGREPYEEIAP